MDVKHFRLLDTDLRAVASVFRIRTDEEGLHVERYDPAAGAWMPGPGSLLGYVNDGQVGADEISKEEAAALIAAGLPALPAL